MSCLMSDVQEDYIVDIDGEHNLRTLTYERLLEALTFLRWSEGRIDFSDGMIFVRYYNLL